MRFLASASILLFAGLFILTGCQEVEEMKHLQNIEQKVKERLEDNTKRLEAVRATVKSMDKYPSFEKYLNICPADHFGSEKSRLLDFINNMVMDNEIDQNTCKLMPELCLMMCKDGESEGCLSLAQALESDEDNEGVGALPGRKAYAMACAAGDPSGCTNRGGGMINYPIDGDAMSKLPDDKKHQCTFKLFSVACTNKDAWGCAMLSRAYALGEGTEVNKDAVKTSIESACSEDPEDGACNHAKGYENLSSD